MAAAVLTPGAVWVRMRGRWLLVMAAWMYSRGSGEKVVRWEG